MNIVRKIAGNIAMLFMGRVLFRICHALVVIIIARKLGVERMGMFETAVAWSNALLALNDLGMATLVVRDGARKPEHVPVLVGNTLFIETILSVVLFFGLIIIGIVARYDHTQMLLIMIVGGSNLLYEFRKVFRGIFRLRLQMKDVVVMEVVNGIFYVASTAAAAWWVTNSDHALFLIAHARLLITAITILFLAIVTRSMVRPRFDRSSLRAMIGQSWVYMLYELFFMLYFQVDQILLSLIADKQAVGFYAAPAKLAMLVLFIPLMVFQVTMPIMFRVMREDIQKYKRLNFTLWRYLAAIGVPSGIGMTLCAKNIIHLVYGAGYDPAIPIMQVFGIFLAVRFIGIGQGNSLTTMDRQGLRAFIQFCAVIINIIADIIIIPQFGSIGPAWVTLCIEVGIAASTIILSARFLHESIIRNMFSLFPVFGATFGMTVVIIFLHHNIPFIMTIIIASILYLLLLWIFRFFRQYDRVLLQQLFKKSPLKQSYVDPDT